MGIPVYVIIDRGRDWVRVFSDRESGAYTVETVAMTRCEDRLRDLHSYAMARYDRLRAEGTSPPTRCARRTRCSPATPPPGPPGPLFCRAKRIPDLPKSDPLRNSLIECCRMPGGFDPEPEERCRVLMPVPGGYSVSLLIASCFLPDRSHRSPDQGADSGMIL
jgi:hypothetical protein